MRTCFVPWCDTICKGQQKRMMFLPPKNKELFEMWKEVLPKRRELKANDKVCERHFKKEDIITTFDHIINGQLFQMERGRPKLKPNAVPCYNFPSEDEEQLYVRIRRGRMSKILKLEVQQLDNKNVLQDEEQDQEEDKDKKVVAECSDQGEVKSSESKVEEEDKDEEKELEANVSVTAEEIQSLYDILYDDIFEVVLPSTLWGVHRDPERQFLAFSYFDSATLRTMKSIVLDCKGVLKIFIFNKLVNEQSLTNEISHELLSHIVSQVDEASICKKAVENNFCEVKAADGSDYCCNCS